MKTDFNKLCHLNVKKWLKMHIYIDGLVQNCSNSSVLAMELLQSCTKSSIYIYIIIRWLSAKLQYLHCISNGVTAALH